MGYFDELVGRRVVVVRGGRDVLSFETDRGVFAFEAEGDCCSHSWFEHITGISTLLGEVVLAVRTVDMEEPTDDSYEKEHGMKPDCLKAYGYQIDTKRGTFEIEMRNHSNGYYGGWIHECTEEPPGLMRVEEDY